MLEGDLAGFLDTQFHMYTSKKDNDMQKVKEKLNSMLSSEYGIDRDEKSFSIRSSEWW